ncbi:MAG: cupin domain-containing protein [Endozoicomonas sp.]
MDVGARLKKARSMKNLSQRELAKRAGVTNSTISMIEKNSVSPSVSSLKKVLGGIPLSMVEFFSMAVESTDEEAVVYRADEMLEIGSEGISMRLVGKGRGKRNLAFLDERYEAGSDSGEDMLKHDGEEAGIVIEGRFELTVNGKVYILEKGDSYYFDSVLPHRFRNPFDEACHLVSCTSPADF